MDISLGDWIGIWMPRVALVIVAMAELVPPTVCAGLATLVRMF